MLKYMASKELVANPQKTALIFINVKKQTKPITIMLFGEILTQEKSAKLLGLTFDDN